MSNAIINAAIIALPLEQVMLIIVVQVVVTMAFIAKSAKEVGLTIPPMVQQRTLFPGVNDGTLAQETGCSSALRQNCRQ